ncbi:MAG: glycerol-3-phosphate dehydrogenase C-terminal domain-containing protein, partial [Flavobacteriaceae bacterium]
TTDTPIKEPTIEPIALEQEIDFILANASIYMTQKPTRKDVKSVFAGLRPLAAGGDENETKEVSRHHKVTVSTSGLVSILGGKWTTYRKMAEDTINTAIAVGGLPERKCITEQLPIHGFDFHADWNNPLHVYGTDAEKIIALDPSGNESLSELIYITPNQIRWAVQEEMAQTLEDVLARRIRGLFLNSEETLRIADQVVGIMAKEMKKNTDWKQSELNQFETLCKNYKL